MASVIRIKRRRLDDPAEALLLSHIKKTRMTADAENDLNVESVLEFAGTLDSKDESISKPIKEAIRRKKIHRQMHPHSSDFKFSHDRSNVTNKLRKQNAESSQNKRYRITCNRRALDIDNLDVENVEVENEPKGATSQATSVDKDQLHCRLSDENKENSVKLAEGGDKSLQNPHTLSSATPREKSVTTTNSENGVSCGMGSDKKVEEKIYCLIDVEHEKAPENVTESATSDITVNGVPMKSVKTKVPVMEESDDYVYDLYFTHTRLGHIQNEAVFTVEALCNEFLHEERGDEGDDFVYDDDDDSNDESNWRNDYPDEDPHFFENADRDYDYENNMRDNIFDGDIDDEGELLSNWMDTRCRIDVDCNDNLGEDYAKDGSSSDEEIGAEMLDY